jgi:hypothetical protein
MLALRSTVLDVAPVWRFLPANARMTLRTGTPEPCPPVLKMREPGRRRGVEGRGPRAALFVLLLVDVVVDDPADGAEEGLVLVVVLTFERLEDPDTEGFIASEPALTPPQHRERYPYGIQS